MYRKILSDKYIHSVRDQHTYKYVVDELGLKAINTGCATMWGLDKEHCSFIKESKSNNVVFTLTDYARDMDLDLYMINLLTEVYENVYFWPQGSEDFNYLSELDIDLSRINILSNSLDSYKLIFPLI